MSIVRKWSIAHVEYIDDNMVAWIAESRAGTGTWVIRESEDGGDGIFGLMVEFDDDRSGVLMPLTAEQREHLGMSVETMATIESALRQDYESRDKKRLFERKAWEHMDFARDGIDDIARGQRKLTEGLARLDELRRMEQT